ncbi:hypothetical protein TcWFU_008125 [Taenia crassiceps]|uniref:BTB domain-containing protein n=1 Tax=Taenia crassiceps TaxID=6207 RepID=A0ABR4QT95_9CEST
MPKSAKKSKDSKASKGSKKGSKNSKGSKSSKKAPKTIEPIEEQEIIIPVPEGVMHRRMRFLLESTLKTDVDFIVGPDGSETTIKAHKCMLAAESPMFERLFADCQEWKDAEVRKREQEVLEIRQREAEVEAELAREAIQREAGKAESQKSKSKGKSKGEEGRKKGGKKSGSKDKSKSKGKDSKGSKAKKSKEKGAKDSSGKVSKGSKEKGSKKGPKAADEGPVTLINFYKDEVIGPDTVRVRDVHPLGFFRLLRYIYYDEMVFTGVVGTIRTLYAARKYCFYDLGRACVNYLENNVCVEQVFNLLQAALDFHEDRLKTLCMRLIINNTFEVIHREDFKDVKKDVLVMILEQDVLNVREIELFDRVMHWAENECDRLKIAVTAMNQRIALGNHYFNLIRFPTILSHEFATHVVESGVLKTDEIIPILQYYITGRKPSLPYSCQSRRRPCLEVGPLDNVSVAYSDQTEMTFVGPTRPLRRAASHRDIHVPVNVLPPQRVGLVCERQRSGSPPARFHVSDEEFSLIQENMRHLQHLVMERNQFAWSKMHMAVMSSHYR